MIEFYPQIKLVHVAAVLMSGGLFFLRGIAIQTGARWGMAKPARLASYAIDTVLLAAGVTLFAILPPAVFANGWLTAKIIILLAYIGLGTFALKRGRTPQLRRICFVAAILAYACMLTIARTHHPLGALTSLLS